MNAVMNLNQTSLLFNVFLPWPNQVSFLAYLYVLYIKNPNNFKNQKIKLEEFFFICLFFDGGILGGKI